MERHEEKMAWSPLGLGVQICEDVINSGSIELFCDQSYPNQLGIFYEYMHYDREGLRM